MTMARCVAKIGDVICFTEDCIHLFLSSTNDKMISWRKKRWIAWQVFLMHVARQCDFTTPQRYLSLHQRFEFHCWTLASPNGTFKGVDVIREDAAVSLPDFCPLAVSYNIHEKRSSAI